MEYVNEQHASPRNPPAVPARKGLSTGCVVGLIFGILLMLSIVPIAILVLHKARARVGLAQEKLMVLILKSADRAYKTEYDRLPSASATPHQKDSELDTTTPDGLALIRVLAGGDDAGNPRKIPFLELPPARPNGSGYSVANGLRDSWAKHGYRVIVDYDGDGKIANPASGWSGQPDSLAVDVAIYSAGPDGDFSTWTDNVVSWD